MAQTIMVMTDVGFTPATVTAQLATLHAANPITLLITGGENAAEAASALWAQQNGIPWLAHGHYLDGAGYDQFARGVALLSKANPQSVLTAGTSAKPTTTAAAATIKGKTVTKI